MPGYAELHVLSNYSFLRGASWPEELVARAAELGYSALAITDECSVAGAVRAHVAAKDSGLKLIVGTELTLDDGLRVVLLAMDREGYGDISELISLGRRAAGKGEYRLGRADFLNVGLDRCLAIWLPGERLGGVAKEEAENHGAWLRSRFPGRCWMAVELFGRQGDGKRLRALQAMGRRLNLPLVAAGDVHMHRRGRRALQDVMTAIRIGSSLDQAGFDLFPNGERHLRPLGTLRGLYPRECLAATLEIASRCHFSLDELRYEYPDELVPKGVTPAEHLRALTEAGMRERFPRGETEKVRRLVEHELKLIAELNYEPYFLTVHDIVRFARSRNILCQGRGSAANSAVCYCLGITEVDPARMSLLFERFVSKERDEPPDIDVDFEHQRREEVIQYIYGKYGRHRAALAATVITYKPRSAIRDIGKALGLAPEQVDRLAKSIAWWDGKQVLPERLTEMGLDPQSPVLHRLMVLTGEIMGFPRHLSQHVGGFVIARGALARLVPIENASMEARTVIQWEKDDLEALGLLKIDILALGMLSAIRRMLDMISAWEGKKRRMQDIPAEDPVIYRRISEADTVGVFQIESRAQMAMLPRLRPQTFYDLVIEVAIVRPGPIQGDMVHPYLRRRQGLEPVSYPSEAVRQVTERTLGIPIFQEQVMQLAVVAAGFTPGEADRLRRAMAAWRKRGGLEPFEKRLIDGMAERGYSEDFARQIYNQILGFGEYGFPESHAASFALLVYVSAWLKHYYPAAFCAGLINAQPMGFYAPAQLVQDAKRHGVTVLPVDVRFSDWDCGLERQAPHKQEQERKQEQGVKPKPALRLGLRMVKGLSRDAAERLLEARGQQPFISVEDMNRRAELDRGEAEALAAAGALAGLSGNRHQTRWQVAGFDGVIPLWEKVKPRKGKEAVPLLPVPTEGEDIVADYESIGLTLGRHPLALLRDRLTQDRFNTAEGLWDLEQNALGRACGIVINRQRPQSANGVIFLTLEDETGYVNVVVWGKQVERYRRVVLGARLIGVIGHVERDSGVLHLVAERLEDHTGLLGRLVTRSRDFG